MTANRTSMPLVQKDIFILNHTCPCMLIPQLLTWQRPQTALLPALHPWHHPLGPGCPTPATVSPESSHYRSEGRPEIPWQLRLRQHNFNRKTTRREQRTPMLPVTRLYRVNKIAHSHYQKTLQAVQHRPTCKFSLCKVLS